jgi:hypothetical protein
MRRPGRLSRLLLCVSLELGALAGLPMRPEQVVELMQMLSQPRLARVLPDENEREAGPEPPAPVPKRARAAASARLLP